MKQIVFDSATMINHVDNMISNETPFQSVVEVVAVQSGSKVFDFINKKYFDYSQSNLAKGILYSKLYISNLNTASISGRENFWKSIHEHAQSFKSSICIVRDIRAGFPENLTSDQMVMIADEFASEEFIYKGFCVDVNIHLHRAEIPHCHFLIPTVDVMCGKLLDRFIESNIVENLKELWFNKYLKINS
jgi:MobA/MobL family